MRKYILLFILLGFVLLLTILFKGFSPNTTGYENEIKLGKLNIKVTSSSYYGRHPDQPLEDFCQFILKTPYKEPKIVLTTGGRTTEYILHSAHSLGRIILNGGSTSPNKSTEVYVYYRDYTKGCNDTEYVGYIVIHKDGSIYSPALPIEDKTSAVTISKVGTNSKLPVTLVSSSVKLSLSDYNSDSYTDYFIVEEVSGKNMRKVSMWDLRTNGFPTWFNDGQPVLTEKSKEELMEDYPQRQFIFAHANENALEEWQIEFMRKMSTSDR